LEQKHQALSVIFNKLFDLILRWKLT